MTETALSADPDWVARQFTRRDGGFRFARWGRPVVPAVLGAEAAASRVFADAIGHAAEVAGIGGARTGTDPDPNFLMLVGGAWAEFAAVPNLSRLIPNLAELTETLEAHGANHYRTFDFDADGAIRLVVALLRLDAEIAALPADVLALSQAVHGMLLWSDAAFADESAVARAEGGGAVVVPRFAGLMRAAYGPSIPAASRDPALAARLAEAMAAAGPA